MNYKLIGYSLDFASFLIEKLKSESKKVKKIILFGSVARKESMKNSDIDLFIEVTDVKLEGKINEIRDDFFKSIKFKKYWDLLGVENEINLSIGKLKEWGDLKRSIIANGIILYGKYEGEEKTKQYYLFIVSPGKDRNKNISIWRELYGYSQKVGKKKYLKEGLVKMFEGKKLARGVFFIPVDFAQEMIKFLRGKKFKIEIIPVWIEKDNL